MSRPTWDQYFLQIAEAVAARSDCERSKVGAVIVKDRRIRATGYNGAPAGLPGCWSCPRRTSGATPGESSYSEGPTRCVAIHAEANAILHCDRGDLEGATLYITRGPCYACQKLVAAAGIDRVVYPIDDGRVFSTDVGIAEVIWPEKLRYNRPQYPMTPCGGCGVSMPEHDSIWGFCPPCFDKQDI